VIDQGRGEGVGLRTNLHEGRKGRKTLFDSPDEATFGERQSWCCNRKEKERLSLRETESGRREPSWTN